jgi:hypothetical protein
MVRVAGPTHSALRDLAATLNTSMGQVVADAVEQYRRAVFASVAVRYRTRGGIEW